MLNEKMYFFFDTTCVIYVPVATLQVLFMLTTLQINNVPFLILHLGVTFISTINRIWLTLECLKHYDAELLIVKHIYSTHKLLTFSSAVEV